MGAPISENQIQRALIERLDTRTTAVDVAEAQRQQEQENQKRAEEERQKRAADWQASQQAQEEQRRKATAEEARLASLKREEENRKLELARLLTEKSKAEADVAKAQVESEKIAADKIKLEQEKLERDGREKLAILKAEEENRKITLAQLDADRLKTEAELARIRLETERQTIEKLRLENKVREEQRRNSWGYWISSWLSGEEKPRQIEADANRGALRQGTEVKTQNSAADIDTQRLDKQRQEAWKREDETRQKEIVRLEAEQDVNFSLSELESAEIKKLLGLEFTPLTADARQKYKLKDNVEGVLISSVDPGSEAAQKKILPGDRILEVSLGVVSKPIDVSRKIKDLLNQSRKSTLLFIANSYDEKRFVPLQLTSQRPTYDQSQKVAQDSSVTSNPQQKDRYEGEVKFPAETPKSNQYQSQEPQQSLTNLTIVFGCTGQSHPGLADALINALKSSSYGYASAMQGAPFSQYCVKSGVAYQHKTGERLQFKGESNGVKYYTVSLTEVSTLGLMTSEQASNSASATATQNILVTLLNAETNPYTCVFHLKVQNNSNFNFSIFQLKTVSFDPSGNIIDQKLQAGDRLPPGAEIFVTALGSLNENKCDQYAKIKLIGPTWFGVNGRSIYAQDSSFASIMSMIKVESKMRQTKLEM
jgi:S1-C subfamily serine protease